ncbi:MAG: hypothetical protein GF353_21170 [Candidatus Lokiarchaeota archaeon]|nr:hypothetical protein [Candidatus Lokiarchaeota archaeon]
MPSKKKPILYEAWEEMINIIPKLREAVRKSMERDQQMFVHNISRVKMERNFMRNAMDFFHGKWALDIIYTIVNLKTPYYNDIQKTLSDINSRTLTMRLKELQKKNVIKRNVEMGQPIRVYYTMTEFGMGVYEMILPFIFYFILPEELRK